MKDSDEKVPVLIVGGGVVGLSASLFLSRLGIASLLVERHPGTSIHPRSRGVNVRTMEIYRELGLEDEIRTAGAALAPSFGIFKGESLVRVLEEQPPMPRSANFFNGPQLAQLSPTTASRVTQDMLEPVLLAAARERGGDLRFSTELVSFEQDDAGVTAIIAERTSGIQRTVRAEYMIAADGAGSRVRAALGVPTSGRGVLGHLLNILFRADLRALVEGREFSICLIERPEVVGLFTSINNADRWVFHLWYDPGKGQTPQDFPPERCIELLRLALGLPEVGIEILSILPWESAVRVADNFQQGRVFLAGDAAHQMPPWGGMGANTGIADAHNLAWKLALVLKGVAAPALLTTYDTERQPVGRAAAEQSGSTADERGIFTMDRQRASFAPEGFARMLGFGYQYCSQAIIPEEGYAPDEQGLYGQPGTRAPHVWVEQQGRRISTLDLLGSGFVLFAGPAGAVWRDAAAHLEPPIAVYIVGPGGDLNDPDNRWQEAYGVGEQGAVLVRPDGFVAWRSPGLPASPEAALGQVMEHVLCR